MCWDKELTAYGIWLAGTMYMSKQICEIFSTPFVSRGSGKPIDILYSGFNDSLLVESGRRDYAKIEPHFMRGRTPDENYYY